MLRIITLLIITTMFVPLDSVAKEDVKLDVKKLIEQLQSNDSGIKADTLQQLSKIGAEAKAAMPVIIKLLDDKHSWVRQQAVRAIRKLDTSRKDLIPTLEKRLLDDDDAVRFETVISIAFIAPNITKYPDVVRIHKILKNYSRIDLDDNHDYRQSLKIIDNGYKNKEFCPKRSDCRIPYVYIDCKKDLSTIRFIPTKDEYRKLQKKYCNENVDITVINEKHIAKIIIELKDKDSGVQEKAAYNISQYPFHNNVAIDLLIKNLDSKHHWVRRESLHALGKITPHTVKALPKIKEILWNESENPFVRGYAFYEVANIDKNFTSKTTPPKLKNMYEYKKNIQSKYGNVNNLSTREMESAMALEDGWHQIVRNNEELKAKSHKKKCKALADTPFYEQHCRIKKLNN